MRRTKSSTPVEPLNPEIEHTLRQLRSKKRIEEHNMDNNGVNNNGSNGNNNNQPTAAGAPLNPAQRAVRDFCMPVVNENLTGIANPAIDANNFELKPALINMVQQNQFGGLATEDPNIHLAIFLEVCATVKMNGVTDDAIRLRLFPFSLRERARSWLQSLQPRTITTWDEMARKFLIKFFPPSKSAQLRSDIGQFRQLDQEPFYEAWERFKELLRRCPQHGYQNWMQVQIFYQGLNAPTRTIVDAAAGGALLAKTADESFTLMEEMATNSYQWPNERSGPRKVVGLYEVDQMTALNAQIAALQTQMAALSAQNNPTVMESVAVAAAMQGQEMSPEQAQFMANCSFPNNYRSNNMPNYYHPGLRNHENFSYANNKNVLQPPPGFNSQPQQEKKQSLEDILGTFILESNKRFGKNEARLDNIETHMTNMGASMNKIETQVGQLANAVNSNQKGSFPSDTVVNPKESCQAVSLRSGKVLKEGDVQASSKEKVEPVVREVDKEEQAKKQSGSDQNDMNKDSLPVYQPPIPYPQ
ncbi:uncharacterized protein LOC133824999 [Humulus lupulus]|uniref:uncharacterized protein LOC133824999 n=1 Tax=Humulus lupulus TaxID=3486 RepID=UPI002B411A7D|nr:uncharacterized protein LOC133824999 [Humulus lupulus]